jgi:signal transduction histidine kinase
MLSWKAPLRLAVRRRGWVLWTITFVVVLALTAAVPMLYLPLLRMMEGNEAILQPSSEAYNAIIALCGMVVIFCLYTALKQRQLETMRDVLEREELEIERTRTRLSELSELFQVSTVLNLQLRLDDMLEIIVRRVVSTLRAQQSSIMIYNPENAMLETRASYGLESEFARHARKRMGEGIAGWVAEKLEAVQVDGNQGHGQFGAHMKPNRNITSALSLPLHVGERCVGVLNVNRINHPDTFQPHHIEVLQVFAEHVGAVLDRAESMERLGRRAQALEADNQKLSETNRLKDVFLSTASHELKTPLTSVIAYAELLDENEGQLEHEQRREFLTRLRGEAMRLLALIEDILDLTRLEGGKMALRRVMVQAGEVAHAAVETSRASAERRGVTLVESHDPALPPLWLDEVKMRQVIVNLIVNAVKFSPQGGTVTVRTVRDGGDFMRVEVTDQGAGVDPEDAPHIFELFGQGAKESQHNRGVGIGLHLVKRLTELHGGHVGVNSAPGRGSTFWVRLPAATPEGASGAESEALKQAA